MNQNTLTDKRKHRRFSVSEKAIGVSFAGGSFHLVNISRGGFSANYYNSRTLDKGSECVASIFFPTQEISIHNLPIQVRWVRDHSANAFSSLFAQEIGVQFGKLTATQSETLLSVIEKYSSHAKESQGAIAP